MTPRTVRAARRPRQFGRKPNDRTKPRLRLAEFAIPGAVPPPPASVDWYSRVDGWPMFLNDTEGDCTVADIGHQIQADCAYSGQPFGVTDADIEAAFRRISPAGDGATIQDALGDNRRNGLGGHKLTAFAELDPSNLTEVQQGTAAFGNLDLGIAVYQGDEDAYWAGADWATTYTRGALLGYHSLPLVGYDGHGAVMVTWGAVQRATWSWWRSRVDEAWAAIWPDWFAATGITPSGYDMHRLGQRFSDLTGDPNPFPAPPPGPGPASGADAALWATAGPWCAKDRFRPDLVTLRQSLVTWADAKGLAPPTG